MSAAKNRAKAFAAYWEVTKPDPLYAREIAPRAEVTTPFETIAGLALIVLAIGLVGWFLPLVTP